MAGEEPPSPPSWGKDPAEMIQASDWVGGDSELDPQQSVAENKAHLDYLLGFPDLSLETFALGSMAVSDVLQERNCLLT